MQFLQECWHMCKSRFAQNHVELPHFESTEISKYFSATASCRVHCSKSRWEGTRVWVAVWRNYWSRKRHNYDTTCNCAFPSHDCHLLLEQESWVQENLRLQSGSVWCSSTRSKIKDDNFSWIKEPQTQLVYNQLFLSGFRWTLVTNKGHFMLLQLPNLLARKMNLRETIKNKLDLSSTVQIYHFPNYEIENYLSLASVY